MEYLRLVYESVSGRCGYAQFYKKEIGLKLLDPVGAVCEEWSLQGTWPQEVNFGDLDYSSSDPTEIAVVLRFDNAILLY